MKIAIVNSAYQGGGAERVARELFQWLAAHKEDVTLYVARKKPDDPSGVRSLRFPWERCLNVVEPDGTLCDWRHIGSRLHLRRFPDRFDLTHFHNLHGG